MRTLSIILAAYLISSQTSAVAADPTAGPPVAAFRDQTSGKYGFIDRQGRVALDPQFDFAARFVGGLAEVHLGDKVGFFDAKGQLKFTLPPGTDDAEEVSEGRIWFQREKDRKWGLCDDQGRVILEPQYDEVKPFSEGLAAVNLGRIVLLPSKFESGKWGFVNKQGKLVIPIQYDSANSFSEGLACVSNGPTSAFIDKEGRKALEVPGSHVGDFREGLAPVHIDRSLDDRDWLTNFIDHEGKTQLSVDGWAEEFHVGLAVLVVKGGDAESNEDKSYGFIDKQGKIVIRPRFGEALAFYEGLAAVRTRKTNVYGMGDTWGFIDKTGTYRIEPCCNQARSFRDGISSIHVGGTLVGPMHHQPPYWEGGEWWLIDTSGRKLKQYR